MFHNLAVPVLHLFIWIVKFLSLSVDELNDDDDDDNDDDNANFVGWSSIRLFRHIQNVAWVTSNIASAGIDSDVSLIHLFGHVSAYFQPHHSLHPSLLNVSVRYGCLLAELGLGYRMQNGAHADDKPWNFACKIKRCKIFCFHPATVHLNSCGILLKIFARFAQHFHSNVIILQ